MTANTRSYYLHIALAAIGILLVVAGFLLFQGRTAEGLCSKGVHHLQEAISSLEEEVLAFSADSSHILRILEQPSIREQFLEEQGKRPYSILIYQDGELAAWSSNEVVPANVKRIFKDRFSFTKLSNGYYEVIRTDHAGDITVLGVIPVYYVYPISNRYLRDGFNFAHPALKELRISNKDTGHTVTSFDGDPLFHVDVSEDIGRRCPPLIWWLQLVGVLLLAGTGVHFGIRLIRHGDNTTGGLVLMGILATVIALHYSGLLLYTQFTGIFSSSVYASSAFFSSLGLLLIFSASILAAVIAGNRYIKLPSAGRSGWLSDTYLLVVCLFNAVIFIVTTRVVKSIVDNSTISFDFYNFYSLSEYSLAGLIVFAIWFAVLFAVFRKTAASLRNIPLYKQMAAVLLCCVFVYLVQADLAHVDPWMMALLFLLISVYFILTEVEVLKFNFINYLLVMSLFAWTTAHIITTHISSRQFDRQKDFISELLFERDLSEEFQLMESGESILEDHFIKRYFLSPFLGDYNLEEQVVSRYFSGFEARYNINLYPFNSGKLPLRGAFIKDFDELIHLFRYRSNNTVSENIRYFSGSSESHKYLIYYVLMEEEQVIGHLFLEIVPKVFGASSAYPELLIAGSRHLQPSEDDYEYAIYRDGKLVKSRGEYEYTAMLNFDAGMIGEYTFYNDQDYHHLVYNNDNQAVVVLSNKKRSIISPFSAFSYTFCFYLLVLLLFWAAGLRETFLGRDLSGSELQTITLQRRIQISMISLVLSSLFIIGVVTLVYFQNQYEAYHNARLLRKANALVKSLNAYMADAGNGAFTEAEFEMVMEERVTTLASVHSLDLNIYSADGRLMITSQPDIFDKELVSGTIDPMARLHLEDKGKSRHVQDERIGRLAYLSAYLPYANSEGDRVAYLNFPYYSKQQSLRADISYFLVALVNVYVLLILTATAIALLLSRSITNSLTIIKERLSSIRLMEKNVPIEWKNKDEIGMLVAEYNRMIIELEKSAELLARSERETAWREMAKQVAHEIKNPLTPMKLSIQHLQRALREGRPDVQELTEQVTNRLIEQIDNLTQIASEFSSFASMPVANLQKTDLKEIVRSTSGLFKNLQHVQLNCTLPDHPCWVMADKNQLIGVFNNLLKNASQAISQDGSGRIRMELMEKDEVFRVEVQDNGVGIPSEKQAKVFEPNFTTKSSGTGLGLAISRNIIEKSKGSIWFESEAGQGTTFYVVLPKMEEDQ